MIAYLNNFLIFRKYTRWLKRGVTSCFSESNKDICITKLCSKSNTSLQGELNGMVKMEDLYKWKMVLIFYHSDTSYT